MPLGSVDDFPPDETRLVTFDNPIRQPWDGMAAHTGVYVRHQGKDERRRTSSWCSPPIVPTWVVRCPGFRSRACSCARATAVSITRPANAPRGRRRAGSFTASGGCARREAGDPGAALSDLAGHAGRIGIADGPHGCLCRKLGKKGPIDGTLAEGEWRIGSTPGWASASTLLPMLKHPIPRGAAGPMGWWYVFGSASMTLLMIQILTGIGLALVYVPAADKAYDSLLYLNYEQPLGWFLRALHYYAGSGMVVMVLAHMTQVFLHGAYKYPRELTWVVGVLLLLCTLGMFFSGQVLRWDPDAYWGLAVAGSMAGRVPVLGPEVVRLVLGGPVIGGDSLSRFFTLHVFVIPGSLLAFLAVHLWLVLKRGISEPPFPVGWSIPRPTTRNTRKS